MLSGYKGVDIWFAPVPLADVSGGAAAFREVELTGTKFTSYVKAQLYLLPVAVAAGLFFWSFLYKISDIPEDYPYAMRFWPRDATLQAFWMTATTTGNEFFMQGHQVAVHRRRRVLRADRLSRHAPAGRAHPVPVRHDHGPAGRTRPWRCPSFAGALLGRFYMLKVFGRETVEPVYAGAGRRVCRRHGPGRHGFGGRRADRQGHYHGALLRA